MFNACQTSFTCKVNHVLNQTEIINGKERVIINTALANGTKPYKFSKEEMENICKVARKNIEQLTNLQSKTEVKGGKGCIILYRTIDREKGVRWAQINIYDKDGIDCALMVFKNGKATMVYTKGTLIDCLKSAEALSYVI